MAERCDRPDNFVGGHEVTTKMMAGLQERKPSIFCCSWHEISPHEEIRLAAGNNVEMSVRRGLEQAKIKPTVPSYMTQLLRLRCELSHSFRDKMSSLLRKNREIPAVPAVAADNEGVVA